MPKRESPIGRNVRLFRHEKGLSQHGLAVKSDVPVTTISRTELGATIPNLATLEAIAAGLGVTVAQLLNGGLP
jgi:transcriptional regulator with XRE-family HTH domain